MEKKTLKSVSHPSHIFAGAKPNSSHEKALGNVLKGKNIEGKKRNKKEVYSNMLRISKEGSDHFQK